MDIEKISKRIKERKEKRKRKKMLESGINPDNNDKIIDEFMKNNRYKKKKFYEVEEYEENKRKALDDDIITNKKNNICKLDKLSRSKSQNNFHINKNNRKRKNFGFMRDIEKNLMANPNYKNQNSIDIINHVKVHQGTVFYLGENKVKNIKKQANTIVAVDRQSIIARKKQNIQNEKNTNGDLENIHFEKIEKNNKKDNNTDNDELSMSESYISNINNSINTFSTTNDKNNSMNTLININQNKNCNKFNLLDDELKNNDKIIKELASELEQSTAKVNKLASNKKEIEENFKNICNKIQPINLKLNNLPLDQIPEQKMNPSMNVRASGQNKSIANQNMAMGNSMQNSAMQNIIGKTVLNTVYSQNPNNPQSIRQSNQQQVQNSRLNINQMASQQKQSVKNMSNNNMLASQNSSVASMQQSQANDLSVFKTVVTGTQVLQNSTSGNQNQNSTVMKNGKVLKNIDINAQSQSQSMMNSNMKPNQSNFPMPNNDPNAQYNNFNNIKAQTIHVSKDKSMMSQMTNNQRSNLPPPGQSTIPSQNPAALQSQKASAMRSNMTNINANNQSIKNSFPMPPNDSINSNNQSVKPLGSTLHIKGNNQSALNNHPNYLMSNIPNANPTQSALNQQHPNLPLQSQNMKSIHGMQQSSNLNQNLSVQNSLNPQQQQSIKQSQQNMMQSQTNKNQLNSMAQIYINISTR